MKLKTPYVNLLPPLSTVEFATLKADVKENGVISPIIVDEDNCILDGHNRYRCDTNAPVRVVKGLSEEEKQAFVIRSNLNRRNLSPDQKREILAKQKALAVQLKKLNSKKWTQARLAKLLGVEQGTVSKWFSTIIPGNNSTKTQVPDARVKLNTAAKEEIRRRLKDGDKQEQIAADFGVSQKSISNIKKESERIHARNEDKARKTAHLKNSLFDVRRGDFREVLKDVEGVSLVLTDPPYPKKDLGLWTDLGKWASKALHDDGILIAYSGQMFLPEVLDNLSKNLKYWWCGCVRHSGSGNLTPLGHPVRKVINQWKPLVMFVRNDGVGFQEPFRDFVEGVGPQKTDHNWQQPVEEASLIIKSFSSKGDLVVDPFAGSGGFCKAAHELKRKAIGAEILDG